MLMIYAECLVWMICIVLMQLVLAREKLVLIFVKHVYNITLIKDLTPCHYIILD